MLECLTYLQVDQYTHSLGIGSSSLVRRLGHINIDIHVHGCAHTHTTFRLC